LLPIFPSLRRNIPAIAEEVLPADVSTVVGVEGTIISEPLHPDSKKTKEKKKKKKKYVFFIINPI